MRQSFSQFDEPKNMAIIIEDNEERKIYEWNI